MFASKLLCASFKKTRMLFLKKRLIFLQAYVHPSPPLDTVFLLPYSHPTLYYSKELKKNGKENS